MTIIAAESHYRDHGPPPQHARSPLLPELRVLCLQVGQADDKQCPDN